MSKSDKTNMIRSKQKYGMISQNIMRHPYISASAKAIYAYLAGFAGAENTAFPARDLICYEMDISKDKFYTYMWELQCWKIIDIEKTRKGGGQFSSNIYILDHYPEFVMMDKKDFEEKIWPELKILIDSKKRKTKSVKSDKLTSTPCLENPYTVKKEEKIAFSPCLENPDTVQPDTAQPDTENQDTNNNILNNNILNNNNNNRGQLSKLNTGGSVNLNSTQNDNTQTKQLLENNNTPKGNVVVNNLNNNNITNAKQYSEKTSSVLTPRNKVKEIFKEQDMSIPKEVIRVLEKHPVSDISKVAIALKDRKQKGRIINPVGLLIKHTEPTITAILAGEFYPDPKPKSQSSVIIPSLNKSQRPVDNYELFDPGIHLSAGIRNI